MIAELILTLYWSFRRINHMGFKNHLHWSSVYPPLNITSQTVATGKFCKSKILKYSTFYIDSWCVTKKMCTVPNLFVFFH
jgi:hypothetical protein